MAVNVTVPQSGESIREVQIGAWRKAEGDRVDLDEILVEIETDKAAIELPAPVAGVLKSILKKAGAEATVGDVIAVIEEGQAGQEGEERPRPRPTEDKAIRGDGSASGRRGGGAPPPAEKERPPLRGAEDEALPGDAPAVMPAARRVLEQRGIDARGVQGSGPGGRILKEDAEAHEGVASGAEGLRDEEIVPMSPMRRVIAETLVAAQRNAALLTTFNEVDMTSVIDLRRRHQEAFQAKHGVKLGFMSFFVKASIEALKLVPQVNAEVRDKNIVFKNYYDIGIAIGGGRGLVVPVVRAADRLSFAGVEKAIGDFAARAKENHIELSELKGGTFSISNGGIYGSMLSTPIVNPPQSGILGLHAIQDRPAAVGGQVVVRPMMYLALSYDHRIVDGREAVTFLKHIKELIEDPVRILVEV